jgi:hypothetical protein
MLLVCIFYYRCELALLGRSLRGYISISALERICLRHLGRGTWPFPVGFKSHPGLKEGKAVTANSWNQKN